MNTIGEDVINENIIKVGLQSKTKDQALRELSFVLKENGYITEVDSFVEDIYEREKMGQTGIGNYIAIPHGESNSVIRNGIAIGKFTNDIPWETIDDKDVRVVCLFCVQSGEDRDEEHLKLLAYLAGRLGNDDVVDSILKAETSKEIKIALT